MNFCAENWDILATQLQKELKYHSVRALLALTRRDFFVANRAPGSNIGIIPRKRCEG